MFWQLNKRAMGNLPNAAVPFQLRKYSCAPALQSKNWLPKGSRVTLWTLYDQRIGATALSNVVRSGRKATFASCRPPKILHAGASAVAARRVRESFCGDHMPPAERHWWRSPIAAGVGAEV